MAHPRDWSALISCTKKKKTFYVYEMNKNEIWNFAKVVKSPLVMMKEINSFSVMFLGSDIVPQNLENFYTRPVRTKKSHFKS